MVSSRTIVVLVALAFTFVAPVAAQSIRESVERLVDQTTPARVSIAVTQGGGGGGGGGVDAPVISKRAWFRTVLGAALTAMAPIRPALEVTTITVEQDAETIEKALGLDRPMRRLLQQQLRNQGFDPGAPDGLFGPRTRNAIRRWQAANGMPPTGYLDRIGLGLLSARTPPPRVPRTSMPPSSDANPAPNDLPTVTEPAASSTPVATDCTHWHTEEFFEAATTTDVQRCLAADASLQTTTSDGRTVLHLAAQSTVDPTVVDALLAAGADLLARNDDGFTPAHLAAQANRNPAVLAVLLAAETSLPAETATNRGASAPAVQAPRNAQLPPEILVDRRLVRVERLLAEDNNEAAHAVMNEIVVLQREHELALPAEFHFTHAKVAFAAGLAEIAVASLNEYLRAAGRNGEFYREALELLDSAEETVRRADADRRRAEVARRQEEEERRRAAALRRENDELVRRQVEIAATSLPRDPLHSGGLAPEMVTVAAGRFQYSTWQPMPGQRGRDHLEWVTFDRPFAMSKNEITRGDFGRFVDRARYRTEARRDPGYGCTAYGSNGAYGRNSFRWNRPGFRQTDRHPVTCISIRDAMAYARWLSQETGYLYRLPSAAEWQYAARAGSPEAMSYVPPRPIPRDHPELGDIIRELCRSAYVDDCFGREEYGTLEVGSLRPNGIGLHDVLGNVNELVLACLSDTGRYIHLTPHGSLENPANCADFVATMGAGWYHNGNASRFTRYDSVAHILVKPELRRLGGVRHKNSQNWTGFRLVKELER